MPTPKTKYTAEDMLAMIEKSYGFKPGHKNMQYVMATEVANGTGAQIKRSLDVVMVQCFQSKKQTIEGIEIKVSKADLRKELENNDKHNIFYENLDYFSLCCPEEIADLDILPKKWGVYVPSKDGKTLRTKRKPLALHDENHETVSLQFTISLARAIATRNADAKDNLSATARIHEDAYEAGRIVGENTAKASYERKIEEYERTERFMKMIGHVPLSDERMEAQARKFKAAQALDMTWAVGRVEEAQRIVSRSLQELHSITDEFKEENYPVITEDWD